VVDIIVGCNACRLSVATCFRYNVFHRLSYSPLSLYFVVLRIVPNQLVHVFMHRKYPSSETHRVENGRGV